MQEERRIDARRKAILEYLRHNGQVRISQLSALLGATPVTIRSDLTALEREGYLERTYGGAVQSLKSYYNLDFDRRTQENLPEKRAIAAFASDLVRDGDTILINSGTTTALTAVALKKHRNINVVTNSLQVAVALSSTPTFRVILLGGEVNAQYAFVYGEDARLQLARYKADWAILSVDGVCVNAGLTTYHAEESVIDQIMMERAARTMIVADSAKLGYESFSKISGLSNAHYWVTDARADRSRADEIAATGVMIRYA